MKTWMSYMAAPSYMPFVSHANLSDGRKHMMEMGSLESKDVDHIVYMEALRPFRNISGHFVAISIWAICQAVCEKVQEFLVTIVYVSDDHLVRGFPNDYRNEPLCWKYLDLTLIDLGALLKACVGPSFQNHCYSLKLLSMGLSIVTSVSTVATTCTVVGSTSLAREVAIFVLDLKSRKSGRFMRSFAHAAMDAPLEAGFAMYLIPKILALLWSINASIFCL